MLKGTIRQNRRFGRFSISQELLDDADASMMLKFMANFIVLRCECNYSYNEMDYQAYSELFEPVPTNQQMPKYRVIVHDVLVKEDGGGSHREYDHITVEKIKG